MTSFQLFLVCLLLLPLAAHFRQWTPAVLFLAAALVHTVFGVTDWLNVSVQLTSRGGAETSRHDTNYVVYSALWHAALLYAFFAALIWLQARMGAMYFPKSTRLLFWPFHLGLTIAFFPASVSAFILPKPGQYANYSDLFEYFNLITSWALYVSLVAGLALVSLLIWSAFERISKG